MSDTTTRRAAHVSSINLHHLEPADVHVRAWRDGHVCVSLGPAAVHFDNIDNARAVALALLAGIDEPTPAHEDDAP